MKYKYIIENDNVVKTGFYDCKHKCIEAALKQFGELTAPIDNSKMKISAHDCLDMGMTLVVEDKTDRTSVKIIEVKEPTYRWYIKHTLSTGVVACTAGERPFRRKFIAIVDGIGCFMDKIGDGDNENGGKGSLWDCADDIFFALWNGEKYSYADMEIGIEEIL